MAITHTKGTLHGATVDEKLYPKNFSDQVLNNNMQPATTTATTENKQVARDAQGNFVYTQPNVPQTDLTFNENIKPEGKNLGSITVVSEGVTDTYNIVGEAGKSAYQVAVDNGYIGTEAEWLTSLKGEQGQQGQPGKNGINGCTVEVIGKIAKFTQPQNVKEIKVIDNSDGTVNLEIK